MTEISRREPSYYDSDSIDVCHRRSEVLVQCLMLRTVRHKITCKPRI